MKFWSETRSRTLGLARYVGRRGHSIGTGASARLQKKFGFTVKNIVAAAKQHIAAAR